MTDSINENLRKIRVLKNYSQEYVAEKVGVSISTYARYEAGKVEIDFKSVQRLANLYNMSIDQIANYGDPGFTAQEPHMYFDKKKKVTLTIELDGTEETLNSWFTLLTKVNTALA